MQNLTPFQLSLLPASFRGVFFHVQDTSVRSGQRIAEHQYPYRDTPFSEPMGKQARQYTFDAFLVGDDVSAQYENLLFAIEADGPGTLVHPTLGQLQVVCAGAEFTQNVAGRYVECRLAFVEAGSVLNPSAANDTQAQTINAAADTQSTTSDSFGEHVRTVTQNGEFQDSSLMNPSSTSPAASSYNDAGNAAVTADNTGFA